MRVGIIGAGIAGLSVARRLIEHGVQVEVFEKARGPGGRIATRRTDSAQFDHGAQYFTVRARLFSDLIDGLVEKGVVSTWQARFGLSDGKRTIPTNPSGIRYVGSPRMSAISRHLAEGIDCSFGRAVDHVELYRKRPRIVFSDGPKSRVFDAVVSTCPPEQSAAVVGVSTRLVKQIQTVEMEPCWALMVQLDTPVDYAYDGVRVTSGPINWVSRNSSKPGRPVKPTWVVHASPVWSRRHLESSKAEVEGLLLPPFLKLVGADSEPAHASAHRWRYARVTTALERERFLWDDEMRIGVVGDWCTSSRVEDAFMNAVRLADTLFVKEETTAVS